MHTAEAIELYTQCHPRWFESVEHLEPSRDYLDIYAAIIAPAASSGWSLQRSGLWFSANPAGIVLPEQGWKLHLSVTTDDSVAALTRALTVLRADPAPFKFLIDPSVTALTNSKLWERGSSGKFVTVYPLDAAQLHRLGDALRDVLAGFAGPYILSDRRWPGSKSVHYRYGAFRADVELGPDGLRVHMLRTPSGERVPDRRVPWWSPPPWVDTPFADTLDGISAEHMAPQTQATSAKDDAKPIALTLEGRFSVSSALAFSNRGGVYLGNDDLTGRTVVVKEARPLVELGRHRHEAIAVLAKEYRILTRLADTGFFVRPICLCHAWEHAFLIEEHVPGESLGRYIIRHHPLYAGRVRTRSVHDYLRRTRAHWVQLARAVACAHARGVTLGDLSFTNVLIDGEAVRICDLETAAEEGIDKPLGLHTPGMAAVGDDGRADDYRALGMLVFGTLVLAHGVAAYHPPARRRFLEELRIDLALPAPLIDLVDDLVERPSHAAADPDGVIRRLAALSIDAPSSQARPPRLSGDRRRRYSVAERRAMRCRVRRTVAGIADYLCGTADIERDDRLFPADLLVFETNPLSVAHGAAGVLHAMHHLGIRIPPTLSEWFVQRIGRGPERPPGLYAGESGIAWVLHELGFTVLAADRLHAAGERIDATACADVLHGAGGHGMACLALWSRGAGEHFLSAALRVGESLLAACSSDARGVYWADATGAVRTGYARGGGGIALFLLYLALASRERKFFTLGRAALAHELAQSVWLDGSFAGFPELAARADEPAPDAGVLGCYWEFGSAGIGTCVARYLAMTGEPELRTWLYRLADDCARKYTAYPQLFRGLAGLGNFLIDAWQHTGDERFHIAAWEAAEGASLFRIDCDEGLGFPGEQTRRESADFATGAAGTGLFLNRLLRSDKTPQPDFNFVVDELLALGLP